MQEYILDNKYTKPGKTVVVVKKEVPFTYYEREFEGDLTTEADDILIKKVLDLALIELDPSGAVAKLQETAKQDQEALKEATKNLKVTSDAVMELTTTFASDVAEIKERLHALDGKGEVEEDTEEHHETTPVTQPVATEEKHEEKHEEAPQPTAPVATEPTVTAVAETPVTPVAETTPVATPTVEATVTPTAPTATETPVVPTTVQGDGNNESNGKVEEHNAETTTSGNNLV
nr:MAG TPA: Protein of unknown function (DUF1366) [Caudoviricetes sp.]